MIEVNTNERPQLREITPVEQAAVAGGSKQASTSDIPRGRGEGSCVFPR